MPNDDYIESLAMYLSDFVWQERGAFNFKRLRVENVLDIINCVVRARGLSDMIDRIIITNDINNDDEYVGSNSNAEGNSTRFGSYCWATKKLFIRLDEKTNPIDVTLTILHELEHAYQAKLVKEIAKEDEIDIFTGLYYLDHYLNQYDNSKKDFKLNKDITNKLNNVCNARYFISPRERFARLNSTSDIIKIVNLMGYGSTILGKTLESSYHEYLDFGYYKVKKYELNPMHIFLLRLYNRKVISNKTLNEFLDLFDEYTKELDSDKCHFLGLRYDGNKKSIKNV